MRHYCGEFSSLIQEGTKLRKARPCGWRAGWRAEPAPPPVLGQSFPPGAAPGLHRIPAGSVLTVGSQSRPCPLGPAKHRDRRFLRGRRAGRCAGPGRSLGLRGRRFRPSSAHVGRFRTRAKFSQHLASGPRQASRPVHGNCSRKEPPGPPAAASREACGPALPRPGPGGSRGRGGRVAAPEGEAPRRAAPAPSSGEASRAARPPGGRQPQSLLEGRENDAAVAAVFRRRPGLLVQGRQGHYLSRLPGGAELGPGWGAHPLPGPALPRRSLPEPRVSPPPPPFNGEC